MTGSGYAAIRDWSLVRSRVLSPQAGQRSTSMPSSVFSHCATVSLGRIGGSAAWPRSTRHLRKSGDEDIFERGVQRHWLFLLFTSPPVVVFGFMVVVLAVIKPF